MKYQMYITLAGENEIELFMFDLTNDETLDEAKND